MEWFDTILFPIKIVVAYIMYGFHWLATSLGLDPASGAAWAISIVGLVIVIRILLIPLFVRQIKAQRGMQLISPELQAIQKKYKGKSDPASREAMSRETMELYRKHGTNPFSSCLPLLAQSPIFFALFRVLYRLPDVASGDYPSDGAGQSIGPITPEVAEQVSNASIFGAKISDWFLMPDASTPVRIVTVVLIVAMSVTTFTTQKQLTQKNMPASALEGPMAQQQKMLLYLLPLVFAISGVNFPIGVLIYWTTTNLWTMGQQFYVIRRNPTPGSEAERHLKERKARKAAAKGIVLEEERPAIEELPRGQRPQPKRKARAKGPRPAGASAPADGAESASHTDADSSHVSASDSGTTPARKPRRSATAAGAGGTKAGAPTTGAARAGAAKAGAPKTGTPKAGAPKAGAPRAGAPKAGTATTPAARKPRTTPARTPRPSTDKPESSGTETTTPGQPGTDA